MKKILLSSLVVLSSVTLAAPQVVTTIKPIYSLAAQVMDGVSEPILLIQQGSPHGYQLKPSDVKIIDSADLVIFASDELETYLPPVLEKSRVPHVIEWEKIPQVNPLPTRYGGMWEEERHAHDHHHDHEKDEHAHDHHHDHEKDEHAHDHHHGHEKDEHSHDHHHDHEKDEHAHDHHHDHEKAEHTHDHHHGKYDAHLWLDTARSQILVNQIARELSEIDSPNASKYAANAKKATEKLIALQSELNQTLEPIKTRPYLVFHDAYQYFEKENGLNAVGTVRVDPEHEPGAKRIGELHSMMKENKIVCVFSEPQFPAKIVDKLIRGTAVKMAVLDPVGADLPADKNMHTKLLRNLAKNLVSCLK